jgi:hypothetical protein
VINDRQIPAKYNGLLFDSDAFAELLREIHARPWEWEQTVCEPRHEPGAAARPACRFFRRPPAGARARIVNLTRP